MPALERILTHQGWGQPFTLNAGEVVTVHFNAKGVPWDRGGISWTVRPTVKDADMECEVEHSLEATGEDSWIPDEQSPFTEASPGSEERRIARLRFTCETGPIRVNVLSPVPFNSEFV